VIIALLHLLFGIVLHDTIQQIGAIVVLMTLLLMRLHFRMVDGYFLFILFLMDFTHYPTGFGSLPSLIDHILRFCSLASIEIRLALSSSTGLFFYIFSLLNSKLMKAPVVYPSLPFDPGTIIFSPRITLALQNSNSLRQVLDHFMECHLATDFGIVSRAMRFDNVLAALLETGQLTSRYYLHSSISPPETGLIITTHLDERTTTIRFASEQE
jgi:hypothetical protein